MRRLVPLLLCAAAGPAAAGDVDELLAGVKVVGVPGVPGPICVAGRDAFPVVTAEVAGHPAPIVAAARWKKGRVVAFGHGGYLGGTLAVADTGRLFANAVRWAAGRRRRFTVAVHGMPHALRTLRAGGFDAVEGADGADVLVRDTHRLAPDEAAALAAHVKRGGGLVTANLGWGWLQLNPGRDLATEHTGNRLVLDAGLQWIDGTIRVPPSKRLDVAPPPALAHAGRALDHLEKGGADPLAVATVALAAAQLPPDDPHLLARLARLARRDVKLPTEKAPLTAKDGLAKVVCAYRVRRSRHLPPGKVRADPAAAHFPGAVPARARRVHRTVTVDRDTPGWQSTGLYAPAGAVLTVRTEADDLALRIGAHEDRLWHKPKWRRAPEITRTFALRKGTTQAVNAFGGPVYVVVPRNADPAAATSVAIAGAVEAPLFRLGTTDPDRWRTTIRHAPAPWAELATDKVVLTLPSEVVRGLDDPVALLRFWDRVLDACADLAARPRARRRPERYVADVQISAGYMHAGYPIMTHLDAAPRFVDLGALARRGDWGMFHEMGHNHQSPDWTFAGTGEVTCNLFSLYVMETCCSAPAYHVAISPAMRAKREKSFKEGGSDFARWKREPFLALLPYMQLRDAFGWDAYKKVFAEYRALTPAERPKSDDDKRDQWLVRFSRAVGRDLGPFLESWGIPTRPAARRATAHLPAWMPDAE